MLGGRRCCGNLFQSVTLRTHPPTSASPWRTAPNARGAWPLESGAKGLGDHLNHSGGDLFVSSRIRMIAVIGQVMRLVECVVRALECSAKVHIGGARRSGRSLDGGVYLISYRRGRVVIGRSP